MNRNDGCNEMRQIRIISVLNRFAVSSFAVFYNIGGHSMIECVIPTPILIEIALYVSHACPCTSWTKQECTPSCAFMCALHENTFLAVTCVHSEYHLYALALYFIFCFFLSLKSGYLHNKRRAHDDEYAERLRRTDSHTLFATLAANKQARQDQCEHLKPRRGTEIDRVLIFNGQSTTRVVSEPNTGRQDTSKRLTPCHTFSLRLERIGKQWSWINREGIHY